MKDKDTNFLTEAYKRVVLREEYYDCYRDCKGLGGSHSECHDECAHLEEEGTGSGNENSPEMRKIRDRDNRKLHRDNPQLHSMRAKAKQEMGIPLTPEDKLALNPPIPGKKKVIEDDESNYQDRAHSAGEKFGRSGGKMFEDPQKDSHDLPPLEQRPRGKFQPAGMSVDDLVEFITDKLPEIDRLEVTGDDAVHHALYKAAHVVDKKLKRSGSSGPSKGEMDQNKIMKQDIEDELSGRPGDA